MLNRPQDLPGRFCTAACSLPVSAASFSTQCRSDSPPHFGGASSNKRQHPDSPDRSRKRPCPAEGVSLSIEDTDIGAAETDARHLARHEGGARYKHCARCKRLVTAARTLPSCG